MVTVSILSLVLCLVGADGAAETETSGPAVREALSKGGYPWYDSKTDAARSFQLPRDRESSPSSTSGSAERAGFGWVRFLGDLITMVGFALGLVALIAILVWLWRIYEPSDLQNPGETDSSAGASRIESLPEGMGPEFDATDPWGEALRRKNRGDYSGAVICLFAHQLLTLSRLGLVRLAPGRTGRQLLRAITDGELRALVLPTLRLFEVVYYGHRQPTEAEFSEIWSSAERFEQRLAAGVNR